MFIPWNVKVWPCVTSSVENFTAALDAASPTESVQKLKPLKNVGAYAVYTLEANVVCNTVAFAVPLILC